MLAEIAVGLPIDKTFHYSVPPQLEAQISVGKRVWVPFGTKRLVGYVVGLGATENSGADAAGAYKIRDIDAVIDAAPVLKQEILGLTRWICEYYFCSWGQAIENALPSAIRKGRTEMKPRKARSEKSYAPTCELELFKQQREALQPVLEALNGPAHEIFLLFGITASGKTEVYLQAISRALQQGKSSIVLVPEISLTPQATERFKSRFGDKVSVIHSRLSEASRFKEWQRAMAGSTRVVIGPRSAVFAPVEAPGLFIIDEEHETSYKQEDAPRYHARDVAIKRAQLNNAPVILGSATPSLESYYNARQGRYRLIRLTERILKRQLPKVKIVDMKREIAKRKKIVAFSLSLQEAINRAVSQKKQAILFLNRRGFATHLDCKKCGYVLKCKKCESVLVYHADLGRLSCHYCGKKIDVPKICPSCEGAYIKFSGLGTQKVESELHRIFPQARIARMDTDATTKHGSHEKILEDFKEGKTDILIGTQMIAKGLDYPQVTLVGVVMADTSLNVPDFRASERTFDLLTQVAGRAGRGEDPSEVIIQTYAPRHYAIICAGLHDYTGFYEKEIRTRRLLGFPPFYKLTKFTFRAASSDRARRAAEDLSKRLRAMSGPKTVGPAPSPVPKLKGRFRWNVFVKTRLGKDFSLQLRPVIAEFKRGKGAFLTIDPDPISF